MRTTPVVSPRLTAALVAILATQPLLVGCGDDDDRDDDPGGFSATSEQPQPQGGLGASPPLTSRETFSKGNEPLDPVQSMIFSDVSFEGGGSRYHGLVQHLAQSFNYLLQGPDALVIALKGAAGNPSSFDTVDAALALSLRDFVEEVLCAIDSNVGAGCAGPGLAPDSVVNDLHQPLLALRTALTEGEGTPDFAVVSDHLRTLSASLHDANGDLGVDTTQDLSPLLGTLRPLLEMMGQTVLDVSIVLRTVEGAGGGAKLSDPTANQAVRHDLNSLLNSLELKIRPFPEDGLKLRDVVMAIDAAKV